MLSTRICPSCQINKSSSEFTKCVNTSFGLQIYCKVCVKQKRKYIETNCSNCGESKLRRRDQVKRWDGRCYSCAQKVATNIPERKLRTSKNARKQVLRQGGIPNAHHFTSEEVRGAANCKWKGGITAGNVRERTSTEATNWRKAILIRDKFTCQLCGQIGHKLQAHHKKEWANFKELRYDLDNGVTLCEDCHKNKAHRGSWRNIPTDWEILEKERI